MDEPSVDWSLGALFGNVIKSQCPLAISRVLVAETCPATGLKFVADPPPQRAGGWMIYDISNVTGEIVYVHVYHHTTCGSCSLCIRCRVQVIVTSFICRKNEQV